MTPKYIQISDQLRDAIHAGDFNAGRLLPTEQQLTQRFCVSRQTIRQALSVLVKEGLIEKRQGSGSRLTDLGLNSFRTLCNIAVVTTYISDYIFPSILRAAQDVLSRNSCSLQLFDTQNQVICERDVLKSLLSHPVDGILVEGTKTALPNPNLDLYDKLRRKKIPMVFFNGIYPALSDAVSVLDDNYGGGYQLVEYLLGLGHRQIAGIFKGDDIQGIERYHGFISALRDKNALTERLTVFWYTTESRRTILNPDIVNQLKGCTAVVCYNDMAAFFLIDLLTKAGVRIPQEMAVVSFDDSYYSELSPIKITSLSHGEENVGRLAAQKLMALINSHGDSDSVRSEVVPWTLKIRNSSEELPPAE